MEQKTKILLVVVGVIALVAGYVVGIVQEKANYAEKITEVNKLLPSMPDVRSVFGTIKAIQGKIITVETVGVVNPFDGAPITREITVSDKTIITKSESIAREKFQELMRVYQEALQKSQQKQQDALTAGKPAPAPTLQAFPVPPLPFKEVPINFSDIKVGDSVNVTAGNNIKMAVSFEAVSVSVTLMPAIVPPPTK